MSDEALELFAMLVSLRKQSKTTPEQWRELAQLLEVPEPQPSLFQEAV